MDLKNKLLCLFLFLAGCKNTNEDRIQAITFVDSFPIDSKKNLYIYHHTSFSHTEDKSYIAIGRTFCEVYKNQKETTIAETKSYVQIDTILDKVAYISSQEAIEYLCKSIEIKLNIRKMEIKDSIKLRLRYYYFLPESCY